jgi:hypothetical protein
MLPRGSDPSTRTSDPSGAIASGSAGMLRVSNVIGLAQSSWPQFTPRMRGNRAANWPFLPFFPLFLLFLQEIYSDGSRLARRNPRLWSLRPSR